MLFRAGKNEYQTSPRRARTGLLAAFRRSGAGFCLLLAVMICLGSPLSAVAQNPAPTRREAPDAAEANVIDPKASTTESEEGLKGFIPKGIQSLPQSLFKIMKDGGLMMIPIVACSVITLAYGLERLVVLRRRRVIPKDFVKRFLSHLEQGQLDRARALKLCEDNGSPIADIFAHAVRKWGKPAVEIEQAVIDGGERQVAHLRKNLRVFNGVGSIGPLLGLLGTTIGMIQCFNEIAGNAAAMGKARQLAGGIGVALTTTAGGLCVAIPAMVLYMYLIGRVDSLVAEMDGLSQKVVDLISAEALAAAPPRTAPAPSVPPRPRAPVPEAKRPVLG